jgi:hypothetical protein
MWVVMRTQPEMELIALVDDQGEARRLADELGPPHFVTPVPRVKADGWRVQRTWACRAVVSGGQVKVAEPHLLAGASRLVLPDEFVEDVERVEVDDEAAKLERALSGSAELHLTAYAGEPGRARELARERGEELAARPE